LEETLHLLYKGQTNVALAARKENISTEQMKQIFVEFVARTPIDSDLWKGDVELSWPYA
jgi:hypothetical protein